MEISISVLSILLLYFFKTSNLCSAYIKINKMLSYRRDTALQGALVLVKSGRLELGDNIYGYYRFIFNHCDIIGLQSYRIR